MQVRHRPILTNTSNATRYYRHGALHLLLSGLLVSVALIGYLKFADLIMDRVSLAEVIQTMGHTRRDLVIERVARSMRDDESTQSSWPSSPVVSWEGRERRLETRFQREGDRLLAEADRPGAAYAIALEISHEGEGADWAVNWRCSNHSDAAKPQLLLSLCPPTERMTRP